MFFNTFFFNDPAPTEIYTLSLHDALPISGTVVQIQREKDGGPVHCGGPIGRHDVEIAVSVQITEVKPRSVRLEPRGQQDRKSTRLNSSHSSISYAVFCLKKKKIYTYHIIK